jgi:hypothetical protein
VSVLVSAQRGAARGALVREAARVTCAAELGTGITSQRAFCDVLIGGTVAESVAVALPARTGTATLTFDLHNRFSVPPPVPGPAVLAWARHQAIVAVVSPAGDVLGRAVVAREFRTAADLFDQIAGGSRPGGVKAVAPGPAEPAQVTIPPGIDAVGIVGSRLQVLTRAGGEQVFDTPGRPVAIVSQVRLAFRR